MHRLIFLLLMIMAFSAGCGNCSKSTDRMDEVMLKTVIGHVDAETLYLINVNDRIKMVVDARRGRDNIFYNPSLEDLLFLEYVSLRREINKVGLGQPGMRIDRDERIRLALELTSEKWNKIQSEIKQDVELDILSEKFGFIIADDSDRIIKDTVPDWERVLWATEIGEVSDLVINKLDEAYFFEVHDKGVNENGEEWLEVTVMYFMIPLVQAKQILAAELSEKWDIRLTNGFYKSLMQYFSCDSDAALESLNAYVAKAGKRDSLAHYFKAHILLSDSTGSGKDENMKDITGSLKSAIATCRDKKIKARMMYKLAIIQKESVTAEKFQEQLRLIFDELSGDYSLVKKLKIDFNELGDDEYMEKASRRLLSLEEQLKIELMGSRRKVLRKGKIREGDEGYLHEDVDEIQEEIVEARLLEKECYHK